MDMADHILQSIFLVRDFFKNDEETATWFKTSNRLLGEMKPIDMLVYRPEKLYKFIKTSLDENKI